MRKLFARGTVVLAVLALAACNDSVDLTAPVDDPMVARIAEMGFNTTGLRDMGDYYLVEGDVILRKAGLGGPGTRSVSGPHYQYATTNRVSGAVAYDIDVNYSAVTSQSSAWSTAIYNAMQQWGSIPGARIFMRNAGSSSGADIVIDFAQCSSDPGVIACADFPTSGGGTGTYIHIDTDWKSQLSSSEKLFTMIHEMGHTLGFRHTNWNNRCPPSSCSEGTGTVGAELIAGTPATVPGSTNPDPGSVMMATVSSFSSFSYYDRVAARALFPGGNGPAAFGSVSGGHPVSTWSAMTDAVSYNIYKEEATYDVFFGGTITDTYIGNTTSTSFTDYTRSVSSAGQYCVVAYSGYVVRAVFANGIESGNGVPTCFS